MNVAIDNMFIQQKTTNIAAAANWLASQKRPPASVALTMQQRFCLTSEEALQAIQEARLIRARVM